MVSADTPYFSSRRRCDAFAYGGPPEIILVMKQTSTAVINLIDAARQASDAPVAFAECFTFITATGTVYTWTSVDYNVVFNGFTFNASGPLVSGLKYKGSVGLEVDKQQITIAARPTDPDWPSAFPYRSSGWGVRWSTSLPRSRLSNWSGVALVIGGVRLFQGRISTVDNVGRTQATLTVASDLVILDYDMPRNLFSPTCLHVLYDAGCGIIPRDVLIGRQLRGRLELGHDHILERAQGRCARIARLHFRQPIPMSGVTIKSVILNGGGTPRSATISCTRCHSHRPLATPSMSRSAAITRKRPASTSSTTSSTSAVSPTYRRRKWPSEDEMKHVFPSDLVVENETAAALRRTLAYLEENGWCQGASRSRVGGKCIGLRAADGRRGTFTQPQRSACNGLLGRPLSRDTE